MKKNGGKFGREEKKRNVSIKNLLNIQKREECNNLVRRIKNK
jgi:hypothetical protein